MNGSILGFIAGSDIYTITFFTSQDRDISLRGIDIYLIPILISMLLFFARYTEFSPAITRRVSLILRALSGTFWAFWTLAHLLIHAKIGIIRERRKFRKNRCDKRYNAIYTFILLHIRVKETIFCCAQKWSIIRLLEILYVNDTIICYFFISKFLPRYYHIDKIVIFISSNCLIVKIAQRSKFLNQRVIFHKYRFAHRHSRRGQYSSLRLRFPHPPLFFSCRYGIDSYK